MQNLFLSLKKSGYKLTAPRKMLLKVFKKINKPMTLNEIHSECSSIDFASVYRSVKLFNEIGLVEEVNFADKKIRYELSNNSHHHHLLCTKCGEIKELPVCILSEIEKLTNYTITKHTFEFIGICPNCKK